MIHAYNKIYLEEAMNNMGDMFDYAANDCNIDKDRFLDLFVTCGLADEFGSGNPKYVAGMSGIELAHLVMESVLHSIPLVHAFHPEDKRTSDYFCGRLLAYYQWYSGRSFKSIHQRISMADIENSCAPLDEMTEEKFAEYIDSIFAANTSPTKLYQMRCFCNLSQSQLAEKTGVSLRSIQMYEQRQKNINNANASTLLKLAKTFGCRIEDLMEDLNT